MSMLAPLPPGPPPPALTPGEQQARMWNMWCHLSVLSGFCIPFGNILGPLLIWQIKKNEIPSVEAHGKAALNFQLTVLIALLGAAAITFVLIFFCIGWILVPLLFLIPLAGVIFAVIAGIKANDGQEYRYPWTLTLIN